ncbi:unnamed protein product [Arctia plantaginis]|uniref:Uncharacterized protein n=1 Tax=Arctia plantaginis TaxID=874455 RepID=A0A8S0ZAR4_ARCPL|nr:unnamed protein product [Arctia plantaginis]
MSSSMIIYDWEHEIGILIENEVCFANINKPNHKKVYYIVANGGRTEPEQSGNGARQCSDVGAVCGIRQVFTAHLYPIVAFLRPSPDYLLGFYFNQQTV